MCGICGFYDQDERLTDDHLQRMTQSIIRRGPDGEGYFFDNGVGLGMRRLAIQDVANGQQPIFNEDKKICVVFNGEIYNFKDLKVKLEKLGHKFQTECDTEVIVHLYEEHGTQFLEKLRGMFALALYDSDSETLIIARDRFGIKPLFFSRLPDNSIIFGSEIKTLLQINYVTTTLDYQALDSYLAYNYIPAPLTIYKEIKKLEPGHYLIVSRDHFQDVKYWDIDFTDEYNPENDIYSELEEKIHDSVVSHMISDVEIGAFLSGGVDSSLVTSIMQTASESPVSTFTVGFEGGAIHIDDERRYSRMLSSIYNFNYNELSVRPDFEEISDDLTCAFDEPFADDSIIPSYYICKETSKKVKVALTGLGGDELFAGYDRYSGLLISEKFDFLPDTVINKILIPLVKLIPEQRNGGNRVDHIKRFFENLSKPPRERYVGFITSFDEDDRARIYRPEVLTLINREKTKELITMHFDRCDSSNNIQKALYTDIKTYLPEDILALSDRISMWHSLELRVPLIDHELAEFTANLKVEQKIDLRHKKIALKKVARKWIPGEIIDRKKQGFEAPMAGWLRNELRGVMEEVLSEENLKKHSLFNYHEVKKIMDDHITGRRKNNKILFALIMFQKWFEKQRNLRLS